jgi:hypothetical protein
MHPTRKALALVTGSALAFNLWSVPPANASVLVQARLGNNIEDLAVITNGPYAGEVAVLDGYDVRAVPVSGASRTQSHLLFDIKGLGFPGFPSGMAYLSPEKSFAFVDQLDWDTLAISDSSGHLKDVRAITYLPDSPVGPPQCGSEGMVYLNGDAAFPDTIARTVYDGDCGAWIQVMGRDGVVQQDIPITGLTDEFYPTGLAYLSSGRFLVGGIQGIWQVGLDGAVISGPTPLPDASDPEGLEASASGRVFAIGYTEGSLLLLDKNLQPAGTRSFQVGAGVSRSDGLFWDAATQRWIVDGLDRDGTSFDVASLSPDLSSRSILWHPPGNAAVDIPPYLAVAAGPDGNIVACATFGPFIEVYDRNGSLQESLDLTTVAGLPQRPCRLVVYLPGIDAYAVRLRSAATLTTLHVISRDGTLLQTINTPLAFVANLSADPDDPSEFLAYGEPDGGDPLLRYDGGTGELLETSSPDSGSLFFPATYAEGPDGTYAFYDFNNSELAVFGP